MANITAAYLTLAATVGEAISIYDGPTVFLKQYAAAAVVPRDLFAAYWCQYEVRNGGFMQFFMNSTGVLAPEAEAAMRKLGLPQMADCVKEAMSWFGPTYPRDRDIRNRALSAVGNDPFKKSPFKPLDARIDKIYESESGGFQVAADRYAERYAN